MPYRRAPACFGLPHTTRGRAPASLRMARRRPHSVFADQLFDTALQLAFFLLALAQPLLEIGDGEFGWGLPAERNASEIVTPADNLGEQGTAFLRDGQ